MTLDQLTVLIITFNEAANIQRTLASLQWANNILVVDSFSTDGTVELLQSNSRVKVVQREFEDFADQCNFGLSQVDTEWTLSIDADYLFPENCEAMVLQAINSHAVVFQAGFDYCIYGKPVRGSILPARTVLYRTKTASYENDGHGHRVVVEGVVQSLPFNIRHDDRKTLSRWLASQITYAKQEAEKISGHSKKKLGRSDQIRKMIILAPGLVFLLVFVFRGGFLSGWRGLFYAMQRFVAELMLSLFLIDGKLKSIGRHGDHSNDET
jgi:glycosyltransferase involved in cell wall biosynthesis